MIITRALWTFVRLFVLLGLLVGTGTSHATARQETLLVVGDSISAAYGIPRESGWVALLDKRLTEKFPMMFDVVNASVSGETTAGGLVRLPDLLQQHAPDMVIVELGGNDGLRGMSLRQMQSNLQQIVELSGEQGAEVVLLSVKLPVSYGVHFNKLFAKSFEDIEQSSSVMHIGLGFGDLNDRNLLQADGIHPTEDAQPILFELIWSKIKTVVESISTDSNP